MSATITIELTPSAQALIERWRTMPRQSVEAIRSSMTKSLEIVTGRIQEKRLSGKGPFPVEEHRLGQVTQQLTRSALPTPAKATSTGTQAIIEGSIGASVRYAAVHEFGFLGEVQVKTFRRKGRSVKAFTRRMNIRARAPFQTGINENRDYISEKIEASLIATLGGAT
jgi:phage gpG-like protein